MRESSGLPRAIVAERELEALRERIAFYESADRDAQAVLARLTDLAQRTSEIRARATAEIMAELERITVALARQQAEGPRAATERFAEEVATLRVSVGAMAEVVGELEGRLASLLRATEHELGAADEER